MRNKVAIKNDNQSIVVVWPWFIRIFHWLLVASIAGSFITAEITQQEQLHAYCGYTVLVLVFLRCVYGCITSNKNTSLLTLVHNMYKVPSYIRGILQKNKPYYIGHNPLGGIMVLVLLFFVMLQAIIGLFLSGSDFDAPLYLYISYDFAEILADVHEIMSKFIIFFIITHVVAVIVYKIVYKENLVKAMITGKKIKKPTSTL